MPNVLAKTQHQTRYMGRDHYGSCRRSCPSPQNSAQIKILAVRVISWWKICADSGARTESLWIYMPMVRILCVLVLGLVSCRDGGLHIYNRNCWRAFMVDFVLLVSRWLDRLEFPRNPPISGPFSRQQHWGSTEGPGQPLERGLRSAVSCRLHVAPAASSNLSTPFYLVIEE